MRTISNHIFAEYSHRCFVFYLCLKALLAVCEHYYIKLLCQKCMLDIVILLCLCTFLLSPSARREWIEIENVLSVVRGGVGLPPHGGSGLKFSIRGQLRDMEDVSLRTEGVD